MSWGAALMASLGSTLDRPQWWVLALAGFLLRGGLLLFLLPIVILPTPAGITNAIAPALVGFIFGSPSDSFILLVVLATLSIVVWLTGGGLLAAWIELTLVGEVASRAPAVASSAPEDLPAVVRATLAGRALGIRLASHLPLALALSWGLVRLVDAVYTELITPGAVTTPIVLRVALRIPEVIILIVVAWLAGETAGGLAVRHLAFQPGRSVGRALARGWRDLLTRPSAAATLVVTSTALIVVAGPTAFAAGFAWRQLRASLANDAHPVTVTLTLGAFVAIWLGGLALVAVALAWRSAAWTLQAVRVAEPALPRRHAAVGELV